MTYFTFLGIFLILPIIVLLALVWRQQTQQLKTAISVGAMSAGVVIGLHVVIAVAWTTPWDNYLVANSVWWYDPALVTGITIGYVPIEEYTFFVLQPIMTGLWLVLLFPRLYKSSESPHDPNLRFRGRTTAVGGGGWLVSLLFLISDIEQLTYLSLELVWALPPILLQLAFGVDILRHQWRLVLTAIIPTTIFLSLADSIAIGAGTWTIDPDQSTGILLAGILPVEELIFFLLTNVLIVFGITLALAPDSKHRVNRWLKAMVSFRRFTSS